MDHGVGGKQIELEALGYGDRLELCDWVGSGDVFWHLMVWIVTRGAPLLRYTQLIALNPWRARLGDDFLLTRDQFIKVFHFLGQVAHLMSTEEEDISLINGAKFVAVERVLFHDQSAQKFSLLEVWPIGQGFNLLPDRDQLFTVVP